MTRRKRSASYLHIPNNFTSIVLSFNARSFCRVRTTFLRARLNRRLTTTLALDSQFVLSIDTPALPIIHSYLFLLFFQILLFFTDFLCHLLLLFLKILFFRQSHGSSKAVLTEIHASDQFLATETKFEHRERGVHRPPSGCFSHYL